ncbi:uncharacterized protein LOC131650940 [Vicia villosa]|uniref:uncharacterized protein LOC131650940 n=1 Tax=Vicia villosa TaxID=3911 RepID=UPI00273BCDAB|nr:uncharacterized protein LOC131650940 [Vicia villosa]
MPKQCRTSSQHRNQCFEEYDDGYVDEMNEHSYSKQLMREESDSFLGNSNIFSKRARIEASSTTSLVQCSERRRRICADDDDGRAVTITNLFCFYDHELLDKKKGIKDEEKFYRWERKIQPHFDFCITSFKSPNEPHFIHQYKNFIIKIEFHQLTQSKNVTGIDSEFFSSIYKPFI